MKKVFIFKLNIYPTLIAHRIVLERLDNTAVLFENYFLNFIFFLIFKHFFFFNVCINNLYENLVFDFTRVTVSRTNRSKSFLECNDSSYFSFKKIACTLYAGLKRTAMSTYTLISCILTQPLYFISLLYQKFFVIGAKTKTKKNLIIDQL